MEHQTALRHLRDDELLRRTAEVVACSRHAEAEIVAHIAEVDERRLYARCACASMFVYCVEVLHFSEAEAYLRIAAARAARAHPMLLDMLADGRLHLSSVARLAPHLTAANRDAVLARACHKSKREVAELLAELQPRPDAPAWIRRLPVPRTSRNAASSSQLVPERVPACTAAPAHPPSLAEPAPAGTPPRPQGTELRPHGIPLRPDVIEATSPGRYKVQFTADRELRDKIERLKELMGAADLAEVIDEAVSATLARLEARRFALCPKPHRIAVLTASKTQADLGQRNSKGEASARSSRHVPAEVRRAVSLRDGGRCAFTDAHGHRCTSRRQLEFHHRRPYAYGGKHTVENTCLLCSTHHALMTQADFAPRTRPRGAPESDAHALALSADDRVQGAARVTSALAPQRSRSVAAVALEP